MQIRATSLACFVFVAFALSVSAQEASSVRTAGQSAVQTSVPRLVQSAGILKDAARPVSGVASVTFAIYAEQDGGASLWSETQNVLADSNGHYSALLGTSTAGGFPSELFGTGESRWLGVTIAHQPEMPRVLMASVPYALKAGDADTLGGLPASSYVTTSQLAARSGVNTTTIGGAAATALPVTVGAASAGMAVDAPMAVGDAAQSSVTQAAVTGTGTSNYLPLWTSGSNLGVSKIYQANGGFVGINTNTPLLQLDVNGNSIFRGSFQMAPQGTATASTGQPSHSFQWQSSVYNSGTHAADNLAFGFRTVPQNNDTASPSASLDLFFGPGGGTLNDTGLSIDSTGHIRFVPTQIVDVQAVSGTELIAENELTLGAGSPTAINLNGFAFLTIGGYHTANSVSFGLGIDSLFNTTGGSDTAIGGYALGNDTSGDFNTGVGTNSLYFDTTGSNNSGFGYDALSGLSNGSSNTALGYETGRTITSGSSNTFVGALANANSGGLTNATAIGSNAYVTESNAIVLGSVNGTNGATSNVNVGIGTTTPAYALEVIDGSVEGATIAIAGEASAAGHTGVAGVSSATSGASYGGYFRSASSAGAGLVVTNTGGGLAASLQGNVQITGTLTKGGGSFKIDDPLDPAGKYLSHSFVESPDMMNLYNGIVTLDAHGAAVVMMPEWFSALNRDFRYTLTAIGSPAPKIYVAEKMSENHFKIAGGKKGQEISWMVTGIRQDAWANAHRIPTEEEKPANQQGKYLHPELFGAGPEQSVNAASATVDLDSVKTHATAAPENSGSR
jgi:hypothetical protein